MKKILFSSAVLVLMAAGCNSSQQAAVTPAPVAQNSPSPIPMQDSNSPQPSPAPAQPAPSPVTTPAKPAQPSVILKLGSSSTLGKFLTASNGMTLYSSSNDTANMSNCAGACAANWPPYTVTMIPNLTAAAGISGKFGTMTRADGSTQVTYKGMPLYFWINDAKAGDTTGNSVNGFAVVKP